MADALVIRARRAVLPDAKRPASVYVTGGRITAIELLESTRPADREVTLAPDEVLLPGLVDTHVHVNEPGRTEWEGFATATRAAAAGGVTTIVDMPLNSVPPTVDLPALALKRKVAAGQSYVDVGFWGGAVPGNAGRLAELIAAGVYGVKCFLVDSGVPEFGHLDAAGLRAAMVELAGCGGLLLVHAEDPAALVDAPASRDYADFLASRPSDAEDRAIALVIDECRRSGARVHLLHVSSAPALALIAAAKSDGLPITAETCPHYLALTAEQVPAGATPFKCCPPIRPAANSDLLWQGLADGTLDCVVTDHSPSPPDLKRLDTGDFAAAWGGISSLQLGFAVVWTEARRRGHPLTDVVGWMSARPAGIAGLNGKGRIAIGYDADFAILAPDDEFTVDPDRLWHRHPVTPYAGRRLAGVVRQTWLRGAVIESDDEPRGRLLP